MSEFAGLLAATSASSVMNSGSSTIPGWLQPSGAEAKNVYMSRYRCPSRASTTVDPWLAWVSRTSLKPSVSRCRASTSWTSAGATWVDAEAVPPRARSVVIEGMSPPLRVVGPQTKPAAQVGAFPALSLPGRNSSAVAVRLRQVCLYGSQRGPARLSPCRSRVLLRDGVVYSPTDPFATAMLVVGDRVAWVGGEGAAQTHVDSADRVVGLGGALVTPAFVDAHVHVLESGLANDERRPDRMRLTGRVPRPGGATRSGPGPVSRSSAAVGTNAAGRRRVRRHGLSSTERPGMLSPTSPGWTCIRQSCPPACSPTVPAIVDAPGFADGLVRRDAHHLARRATRDAITADRRRDASTGDAAPGSGSLASARFTRSPPLTSRDQKTFAVFCLSLTRRTARPWSATGERREPGWRWPETWAAPGRLAISTSTAASAHTRRGCRRHTPTHLLSRGFLYLDPDESTEHVVACTRAGLQAGFHCIGDEAVRDGCGGHDPGG